MDYYTILGITKNASPEEIKRAYRKLAMECHPDRTGGDDTKFKKINEAYEILSNSDKRNAYDNPQPNFNNQYHGHHNPFGSSPFDNIFGQGFAQQRQTPRNRDISIQANIDLVDVLTGKNLIIQYQLSTGRIETVTVDVPAGAKQGDIIQYQGLGDEGHPKYPRGNLHVRIKVNKSKEWERDADNLITKKVVNVFDLLLGCAIIIRTLDNKQLELKIPQGTQPGTKFSISGYGLPNMQTGKRGIIFIIINTEIPKISNEAILNKIQQLKNEIQ